MTLVGNGGTMTTNQMATIRNLDNKDPVWYHPEYITNILFNQGQRAIQNHV